MISRTAKIIIAAALSGLMAGSFAMPTVAGDNTRLPTPDGRTCMSINQVETVISRHRCTNIQFKSGSDCICLFSAKRTVKCATANWEMKYDALDKSFLYEERIYF
jgi:hypothetical protein